MSDRPSSSILTSPAAIVVAGALIAAAIYFDDGIALRSAGNSAPSAAGTPSAAAPNQPPATPAVDIVKAMRPVTADDHIRGNQNAKITIVEYSDLECPFCKRFHTTLQEVVAQYPNDVRWVYRHFPLVNLHSKAPKEAEAAECAGEQGKFWEFVDQVFTVSPTNNGLDLAQLPVIAGDVGVANIAQFQTCLDSGKYADKVDEDLKDAQAVGGRGTPYSIILGPDGKAVPVSGAQPASSVTSTIDGLL